MKSSNTKENREYWKTEEEDIIRQWCDKALCYQWMHSRCREIYQKKNAWYTIPVIIISTVTGTANFAQDRFSDDVKDYVVMSIGTLSIIAGIITTIYQFLQISELNEGYRAASISWNKYHNNLKTLITRHPLDRLEPTHAIKIYKDEYEHLCEVSPPIVKTVLKQFNSKFKKITDLSKPEICSKLVPTNIYDMSVVDRENMINKINNKKKQNPKLMETFFNLNGRNACEDELNMLQTSIENNNIDIHMDTQSNYNNLNEAGDNNSDMNSNLDSPEQNINSTITDI